MKALILILALCGTASATQRVQRVVVKQQRAQVQRVVVKQQRVQRVQVQRVIVEDAPAHNCH